MSAGTPPELQELLVNRVAEEVLYQIGKEDKDGHEPGGTAVLLTSYVPDYFSAIATIEKIYPEKIEYIGFQGYIPPEGVCRKTENAKGLGDSAVMGLAERKKSIVLPAPKISLLEAIAGRQDDDIVVYIVVRSLLWGKNVSLLMDFESSGFRSGSIFGRVNELLGELRAIGIEVRGYEPPNGPEAGLLQLVTERDIMDAYVKERLSVRKSPGAIVTPAAKDAARELNIRIDDGY